jgi:hypothetical protein
MPEIGGNLSLFRSEVSTTGCIFSPMELDGCCPSNGGLEDNSSRISIRLLISVFLGTAASQFPARLLAFT